MQGEESDAKSDRGYTEEWTSSVTRNMRGMWYKPLSYRTSRTGDARLLGAQAPPRRGGGGIGWSGDACVAPVRGSINPRFLLEQKRQTFGDKELGGRVGGRRLGQSRQQTLSRGSAQHVEHLFQGEDAIAPS